MGDRLEERKDFTPEVTAKLPEAKKLAQVCRYRSTGVCVCVRVCWRFFKQSLESRVASLRVLGVRCSVEVDKTQQFSAFDV